ncbi:CaiB/BaiF CoA transferase family protein [Alteromonas lipolytica]|uniref:Acyl-CoA transferase n=1 Tax=Alteromonas lipolytica TaxID=1856405 RepID=A0A1E8FIS8_9ALTE|nr:CoA transferase [Alteromonas lipolytica]OFI35646.1 acyl-CoA transferase [Alteromonas lipolytica]GGF77872.1 CoA transferase [Alteromonas lipolytica]
MSRLPFEDLPVRACATGIQFLQGIRVIDLTTSVAGPYATLLLGDFGAEVLKVERPNGDDARHWGPPFLEGEALWFVAMNRNKKSITMDMRDADQRAMFDELVKTADVVVTNQPPNVQKKLKLDYDAIKGLKDDIIFVSISGFGLDGERADLTCYDLIAEGYSGIMDITGAPDSAPQKIGAPAADMLAGQDAAMATMAALFEKQRSGKGAKIDVSLVQSMTRFLACRISPYLGAGEVPKRSGGTDSVIAIYQAFETADEPITLGLGSDAIWQRFWQAVGDEAYGANEAYGSNVKRREHRADIVAKIQSVLISQPRAHWLEVFGAARIPAGPINSVDQVCADKHLKDRGMFYTLEGADGRRVPQIGLGININDQQSIASSLPPKLGEHNDEILNALRQQK